MPVNGKSVALTAVGGVLLWSGVTGTQISTAFRDVVSGEKLTQDQEPISGAGDSGSDTGSSGSAGSSAVASDALKYAGSSYVWGGAPGTTPGVDNGTDCSGFVNMVVGRDLGGAIPGYAAGSYTGSTHGPTTLLWLAWTGCTTISSTDIQPGDLACWQTHMGIYTDDGSTIISALDTQSGVVAMNVADAAPPGEVLFIRRLKSV